MALHSAYPEDIPEPCLEDGNTVLAKTYTGSVNIKGDNVHQANRDMLIGSSHSSAQVKYFFELIEKLPNQESFLNECIRLAIEELNKNK